MVGMIAACISTIAAVFAAFFSYQAVVAAYKNNDINAKLDGPVVEVVSVRINDDKQCIDMFAHGGPGTCTPSDDLCCKIVTLKNIGHRPAVELSVTNLYRRYVWGGRTEGFKSDNAMASNRYYVIEPGQEHIVYFLTSKKEYLSDNHGYFVDCFLITYRDAGVQMFGENMVESKRSTKSFCTTFLQEKFGRIDAMPGIFYDKDETIRSFQAYMNIM